jgi:hypothetical protein
MSDTPLRLAVVSTPRVGNSWIRVLISDLYQVASVAYHELSESDWQALPAECVLQIHWRREPDFAAALQRHGFRVLTVARHPLDVLISILQFAVHEPDTARWLCGRHGDETGIWGAMPRSRPFLEYATGPRAAELLAVTRDWWAAPGVVPLRYEDFVADPVRELNRLAEYFGSARADASEVRDRAALGKLPTVNSHFWQGKPGLWRALLPAAEANEIRAALAPALAELGYACDPDPALDAATADRNWVRLAGPSLRAGLARAMTGHRTQVDALHQRIAELEAHFTRRAG